MVRRAPGRGGQSYRHEALLWQSAADFTRSLAPFLREAADAGEPTLAAVLPEHGRWLRAALGARAEQVEFIDIQQLGENPARVTSVWRRFIGRYGPDQPIRGIGEIVWPGRRADELAECQLHEALLNVAVDPNLPLWLICPYDAGRLPAGVLEAATRSHPVISEPDTYRGSAAYAGGGLVDELFGAALPEPHQPVHSVPFETAGVRRLRGYLRLELHIAGLPKEKAEKLTDVVLGLVTDSLHRRSGGGMLRVWHPRDAVVCEVDDDGRFCDPLAGREPNGEAHEALWLANQTCDLVQLRSNGTGTAVRVYSWIHSERNIC